MVVERNDKTFDGKMNALINVWKISLMKKWIYKTIFNILFYMELYYRLANLSKFMNYCIYLSLLVDNSDDHIYNRQIDLLGSGTIFKLSVAGPSTSMAEAENTKSARCKKNLKGDSIKKTLKLAICFTTIPALKDHKKSANLSRIN